MNEISDIVCNYCYDKDECIDYFKQKFNNNARYKFFNQSHFTAGDYDQFDKRDRTNGDNIGYIPKIVGNMFNRLIKQKFYEKYQNINPKSIQNTFQYIFNKFKKGIFIKITNNKITTFLPFSNVNYINEWSTNIKLSSKWKSYQQLFKYICEKDGYTYNNNKINSHHEQWYANNFLVRYEYPIYENDSGIHQIHDMFLELCKHKKIPDIELFINKRDFPLLHKNGLESYNELFSTNQEIISHNYDKYCPILSMATTSNHADIAIPTWEDWSMVSNIEDNKFFKKPCKDYRYKFNHNWDSKKNIAVFRGSSTGKGIDINTNNRLKVANISHNIKPTHKGHTIIDAGITSWNLRPRITNQQMDTINIDDINIPLSDFLNPEQQSNYKYIINIEGHSVAYRLSLELGMGSVILLSDCQYKLWFQTFLKPYIHYVPVKNDLSDLVTKIKWCIDNDDKCKKIAKNALDFYNKYLTKNSMLDYLESLLNKLKKHTGYYIHNYQNILEYQLNMQKKQLILNKTFNYTLKKKLFESNSTTLSLIEINNHDYVLKERNNDDKYDEFINSIFVSEKCMNELSFNFSKIIDYNNEKIIMENLDGVIFSKWLTYDFNFTNYLSILLQISLSLIIAQEKYGFVHYDLYPWNIIIKKLDKRRLVSYKINNKEIRFYTMVIPIIIDYGRSHIIYKKIHYGTVNLFKFSSIQDIISLLVSSINIIIIKYNLNNSEKSNILKLSNFISNTKYTNYTKFNSINYLKKFTSNAKKFNQMLYNDKYELEDKNPGDFIDFILKFNKIPNVSFNYNYLLYSTIKLDEYIFSDPKRILSITNDNTCHNILHNCNIHTLMYYIDTYMRNDYNRLKESNYDVSIYEEIFSSYINKFNNYKFCA